MRQPVQNLRRGPQFRSFRNFGSIDHKDGQPQGARRIQLGPRATAARILGHNQLGAMAAHQLNIALNSERPARDLDVRVGHRHPVRLIHQTQQVVVLGLGREVVQMHTAHGKEHALSRTVQRLDSSVDIRDTDPIVCLSFHPRRARQCSQRRVRLGAGLRGVPAHLRGKGVRGVDHMGHAMVADVTCQPFGPTKAANTGWQRLRARIVDTPRVRIGRVKPLFRHSFGQSIGLGCAAKNKEVGHV